MTALSGPILFNNSTGSDTAASGCGPATAVTTQAMFSSGSAGITVSSSSGMSVGDLIYVPANTGRKFNVIASISGTSITCDSNWDDSQMGVDIYVGGKRATLLQNADSRRLFESDTAAGMVFEFASGHVETGIPAVNTSVAGTASSPIIMRAETGYTTRPKFSGSSAAGAVWFDINNDHWHLDGLEFTCPSGVSALAYIVALRGIGSAKNCVFDAGANYSYAAYSGRTMFSFCLFKGATNTAISNWGIYQVRMNDCLFQDSNKGFSLATGAGYIVDGCIFQNITNEAIYRSGSSDEFRNYTIKNCIFHDCGTGFSHTGTLTRSIYASSLTGCIFSGNTTGVEFSTMDEDSKNLFRFENNAFYGNTTDISGVTHLNKITLTADPFVDAANGDFNISDSAGGGATLRSTNYTLGG